MANMTDSKEVLKVEAALREALTNTLWVGMFQMVPERT